MHVAAAMGHAEAIGALVKAGASLDARTDQSGTPLHVAAASGHADAIRALVQARVQEVGAKR